MLNDALPQNAEAYMTLFRQLAAITDRAMDYIEENSRPNPEALNTIAQNVATITCLRGDSGIYASTRPADLDPRQQHEMYDIEDALNSRLLKLGYRYPRR